MTYEQELDIELSKESVTVGKSTFDVKVMSYNGGKHKVQIQRKEVVNGDDKYQKLGRLTKSELIAILPILKDVVEKLPTEEKSEEPTD